MPRSNASCTPRDAILLHPRIVTNQWTWPRISLLAVGWIAAVVVLASQEWVAVRWSGGPIEWRAIFLAQALTGGVWVILVPVAIAPLSRRFRISRPLWSRSIIVHVVAAFVLAAFVALATATLTAFYYYGGDPAAIRDMFRDRLYTSFAVNLLSYAVIVAVIHALSFQRESERRSLDAARLETRMARAELTALYNQLQPHFLFNTFNSMIELVHSDPPRAAQMLRGLSDLLRRSLTMRDDHTATLGDELDFLRRYVTLQQMRFEQLVFEVRADESALGARVPRMLLQPLVENAIHFTIGLRGRGSVTVVAARHGERVELLVIDDGPGFSDSSAVVGFGRGLAVTQARLEALFGDRFSLSAETGEHGGGRVLVTLPYTTAAPVPSC